jgi:hypothetical protein
MVKVPKLIVANDGIINCRKPNSIERAHVCNVDYNPKKKHILVRMYLCISSILIFVIVLIPYIKYKLVSNYNFLSLSMIMMYRLAAIAYLSTVMYTYIHCMLQCTDNFFTLFLIAYDICLLLICVSIINSLSLLKVTAEEESGICIWDLRKPKVPIQELPGHTHW